jgi:hypothetical protein
MAERALIRVRAGDDMVVLFNPAMQAVIAAAAVYGKHAMR